MKKLFILSLVLLAVACENAPSTDDYQSNIKIGSAIVYIEIANDNASRAQGLSGRTALAEDRGMLFDFSNTNERRPGFWMKDMRFGLDMIWVYKNSVVGITTDVPPPQPGQQLKIYYPPADIDAVVEVNAGWSQRHGVKVGDEVKIQTKN